MALSVEEYRRAWESDGARSQRYNRQIVPGSCVLETLALVTDTSTRYVFVDDFGDAVSYCRQRLLVDLVPPDQQGNQASFEQWSRLHAAFAPEDLAIAWVEADDTFSALLDAFIADGASHALIDRLRTVVNRYGLDLELGAIWALPQDLQALLAQIGDPFVWWDEAMEREEQERQPFDFENEQHRAMLARRLSEQNELD